MRDRGEREMRDVENELIREYSRFQQNKPLLQQLETRQERDVQEPKGLHKKFVNFMRM
jgi:hypothetical protein